MCLLGLFIHYKPCRWAIWRILASLVAMVHYFFNIFIEPNRDHCTRFCNKLVQWMPLNTILYSFNNKYSNVSDGLARFVQSIYALHGYRVTSLTYLDSV